MAKMKIQISKDDFEQSILVATSSHSEVFESVRPHFYEAYNNIQKRFLGYADRAVYGRMLEGRGRNDYLVVCNRRVG